MIATGFIVLFLLIIIVIILLSLTERTVCVRARACVRCQTLQMQSQVKYILFKGKSEKRLQFVDV